MIPVMLAGYDPSRPVVDVPVYVPKAPVMPRHKPSPAGPTRRVECRGTCAVCGTPFVRHVRADRAPKTCTHSCAATLRQQQRDAARMQRWREMRTNGGRL